MFGLYFLRSLYMDIILIIELRDIKMKFKFESCYSFKEKEMKQRTLPYHE